VSERVARSRELVAQGRPAALVARVAGISRQAIYRRPKRAPKGQRRPLSATDRVVLGVARGNPTDGTRMVAALAGRDPAGRVNRKRVQRLMREHRLLQPKRSEGRRRRPGYFQVTRPDELWHLDMTAVWVAEHGWCYLDAAIDCCTREITGWALDVRCRAAEAIAVIDAAIPERSVGPGELTLGTDNGTAFTSRAFRGPAGRARHHTPARRLPRPREPGLHRVLVFQAQAALHLARRVRDPRRGEGRHRRLRRRLPPPAPPRPGLPHPTRGRGHLEGCRRPVNPSGLTVNPHGVHARPDADLAATARTLKRGRGCGGAEDHQVAIDPPPPRSA
jgi:transposase InsO family protein